MLSNYHGYCSFVIQSMDHCLGQLPSKMIMLCFKDFSVALIQGSVLYFGRFFHIIRHTPFLLKSILYVEMSRYLLTSASAICTASSQAFTSALGGICG